MTTSTMDGRAVTGNIQEKRTILKLPSSTGTKVRNEN